VESETQGIAVVYASHDKYSLYRNYLRWQKIATPGKSVYVKMPKSGPDCPAIVTCFDKHQALRLNPWVRLLTWNEFDTEGQKNSLHLSL